MKKSLYNITSDNNISSIENQRNGIAENNWQYEYFTNMLGLKNATLNAGSGNTQYDAYSREDFEYDLAGNPYRYKSGTTNWNTVSSNKNNQTTQINYASDAVLPIRGKAPADATLNISVDGVLQNYTRPIGQEEFVFGLNAYRSTRKYHEVKAESVETDNNTTPPTTIRTMRRGKAYIEATPENFTYDDDGNMTYDGRWNYSWNSRGRIRDIETSWDAREDGIPYEAYTYTYDWIGRKIQTDYYVHDENWTLVYTNKRYYDDYNLIYETTEYYDGTTPTEVKKYYYGTDLLGSVYGSAGTGGLRMMEIDGEDLFALNNQVGSIEALYGADADSASAVRAEYVYSAYGEVMMKSGDLADKNNIGYSTRYQEANTGLVSYTYRHYSPRLKKWLSKDPIAENGGINLYQMVGNQPVNIWDKLGYVAPCSIDIFVGHGASDRSGSNIQGTVNNAVLNASHVANRYGYDPSGYAIGATSCKDNIANGPPLDQKYSYPNPNRTDSNRYGPIALIKALKKEIKAAKKHAEGNMCNKPPACCKKIKIKINWIFLPFPRSLNPLDPVKNAYKFYGVFMDDEEVVCSTSK